MALKFKFKSKDEIPAEHAGLYIERDGAFVLDAEGAVEKAKLDEFRTNNLTLQKQLADLNQRFEGIEPEQVKALMEEKRKLEEAKHLKEARSRSCWRAAHARSSRIWRSRSPGWRRSVIR